jgi:hypothetical protein
LRPEAKTEAVNPGGRLMDGGRLVLKNAVLFIQFGAVDGFDTVCASVTVGSAKSGATINQVVKTRSCIALSPLRLMHKH